ncbi:MAG: hypothetical protein A4E53_02648 [Pelotomaculum sp. PtaB.Bin104]|nr:MAG: hypothetical protein A4E53_02648 [Pelotomaculum sp. PtaB.Bin104]
MLIQAGDKVKLHPGQVLAFIHNDMGVLLFYPLFGLAQGKDSRVLYIEEPQLLELFIVIQHQFKNRFSCIRILLQPLRAALRVIFVHPAEPVRILVFLKLHVVAGFNPVDFIQQKRTFAAICLFPGKSFLIQAGRA